MKKLFTVLYGSYLYGTNTEKSDKDYKIVYLPDLKSLLLNDKLTNKFTSTSDSSVKNTKDDVDVEYIPFQRLVMDFYNGQTYALELVFAVCSEHPGVTIHDRRVYGIIDVLASNYLTNSIDAMIGFANSQSYKYGIKGRRYKSIVSLYDTICLEQDDSKPLLTLFDKIELDEYVKLDGTVLCVIDKRHQGGTQIKEVKDRIKKILIKYGDRTKETENNGCVDWKSISHAVRISGMCANLLKHSELMFPLVKAETTLIKAIKSGELPWDQVENIISNRQDIISELKITCTLPPKSPEMEESLRDQLYSWLKKLYDINNDEVTYEPI